jgi:hypothetical protein
MPIYSLCSEPANSPWLPEIHLINSWLLGEKRKPIIIRDAHKALHFEPILFSEKLAHLGFLRM